MWFDKLTIECIHGNILDMETDAIACNVNLNLDLNYSLGKQLSAQFGPDLRIAVDRTRQNLPTGILELGQAIFVPITIQFPLKGIVFFGWWTSDNEFTKALIYKSFVNVLRTCFEHQCSSIAIPLFGSGSGSMSFQLFQGTIVQALQELNSLKQANSFSVEELYFVSTDNGRVEQLKQQLLKICQ